MKCFVIMPFAEQFDPVFAIVQQTVARTLPSENIECVWLKDVHAAGKITDDILHSIGDASFCVADITGNNPNVMWETGYAMALDKPTILIAQDLAAMPFDLQVHRVLPYAIDHLNELGDRLKKSIEQTLARYDLKPSYFLKQAGYCAEKNIAVTGSMNADPQRLNHRLPGILEPYLSRETTWYCGSNGLTDDLAIRYLLDRDQRVVAIGYNRFDASRRVREWMGEGRLHFLDASVESVPTGFTGPSPRDILFAMRADLVVLMWDGASRGTLELIEYFKSKAKNLLIGFI
jgi:hypothetical protein